MTDEVMEPSLESAQQKEQKIKDMIRNTFETVADAYGLGGARFFSFGRRIYGSQT